MDLSRVQRDTPVSHALALLLVATEDQKRSTALILENDRDAAILLRRLINDLERATEPYDTMLAPIVARLEPILQMLESQAPAPKVVRDGEEVLLEMIPQQITTPTEEFNVFGAFKLFMADGTRSYKDVSGRIARTKGCDSDGLLGLRRKFTRNRRVHLFAEVLLRTEPANRLKLVETISKKLRDDNPRGLLARIVRSKHWRDAIPKAGNK